MEFSQLVTADAHEAGAEMEILHPATGEKTGAFLLIRGIDSRTFRAASSVFNKKRLEKDADIDALSLDLTVAVTVGWRGIKQDGADILFTKDALRSLLENSPAIRQQVDSWFTSRRNFMKG